MARLEISGIQELERTFERMGDRVRQAENTALRAGGRVIQEYQQKNINRSTKDQPHLKDNITITRPVENDEGKHISVGPKANLAWRARFLEYGTSKMPAYPFASKSVEQGEDDAVGAMAAVFRSVLRGV